MKCFCDDRQVEVRQSAANGGGTITVPSREPKIDVFGDGRFLLDYLDPTREFDTRTLVFFDSDVAGAVPVIVVLGKYTVKRPGTKRPYRLRVSTVGTSKLQDAVGQAAEVLIFESADGFHWLVSPAVREHGVQLGGQLQEQISLARFWCRGVTAEKDTLGWVLVTGSGEIIDPLEALRFDGGRVLYVPDATRNTGDLECPNGKLVVKRFRHGDESLYGLEITRKVIHGAGRTATPDRGRLFTSFRDRFVFDKLLLRFRKEDAGDMSRWEAIGIGRHDLREQAEEEQLSDLAGQMAVGSMRGSRGQKEIVPDSRGGRRRRGQGPGSQEAPAPTVPPATDGDDANGAPPSDSTPAA